MIIEIRVKYEALLRKHTREYKFVEVVDIAKKLKKRPQDFVAVNEWLSGQLIPFYAGSTENPRLLKFTAVPPGKRPERPVRDLLESFLDIRSEPDVVVFARQYGMLWQLMTISPVQPKPYCLGTFQYEPVAYWLRVAALFRIVRQLVFWLSADPQTRLKDSGLMLTPFVAEGAEDDDLSYREVLISLQGNDEDLAALGDVYLLYLPRWWNVCRALRFRWQKPQSESPLLPAADSMFRDQVERSVFLNDESTHLEFVVDTLVREILNQIIQSETQVEVGKGGYVFSNLSLLGVLANQMGAFYRGRGQFLRICQRQGCKEPIDPKRRADARYCPPCKAKVTSMEQNKRKREQRQLDRQQNASPSTNEPTKTETP